ncbi:MULTISPECIES: Wzz/FepE/Etk N-terminal domain-containing protein [unclassified Streptomyces]|uniref:Wzz/FepE/Etk N-terminal domain-containing protein n=1 Tax=unclassified Streptomyces TaxID=2593676 RepID=UPI00278BC3C4|nr:MULTISPECIES: Wzz/FepE/Etk N-terminal domain-containing protein [unclassified Streptomyces]
MSEDTIRLVTIGRMLRRRWRLLATLTVVGALVGYGMSMVFPPRYTASASVLLPGQWEEREMLTQVDIATSSSVTDRAAAKLGWNGVDGSELRKRVSAKAADGNVITISGAAENPKRAQQLTNRVAKELVSFSARIAGGATDPAAAAGPEALRKKVQDTNRRITELAGAADPGRTVESVQARTALEKLRTSLEEAMKKLEETDPASDKAGMVLMDTAAKPTGQAPPTRLQLVVAGALLFFIVTVIAHLTAARMNRRLRGEAEIAAALGSKLLGTVDVPGDLRAHRAQGGGAKAGLRRLLGLDIRWDVPAPQKSGDEAVRRTRFRRVCAKLRNQLPAPRRLLVVVPDGDELALRAAGQLVAEAGSEPSATSSGRGYPMLRTVVVPVDRPIVPDRGSESGAVVVLSAGSWTAEELAGIAGACADGRHEIVGIVVAGPVLTGPARSAEGPPDHAAPALAVRGHATGGSA